MFRKLFHRLRTHLRLILLSLSAVALLSSWIPARRAAKVNPMVALRRE